MPRVILQFSLAAPLAATGDHGHPSLLGAWIRERIASAAIDWPGVAFDHIRICKHDVRLGIIPPPHIPPAVVGIAIARAITNEINSAVPPTKRRRWRRSVCGRTTIYVEQRALSLEP